MDGASTALPRSWTRSGESVFCLGCSRELAGEAALDAAPAAALPQERARIRRHGVIRFEIVRTPLAPDRTIAQACHTSPGTVAAVRDAPAAASSRPS